MTRTALPFLAAALLSAAPSAPAADFPAPETLPPDTDRDKAVEIWTRRAGERLAFDRAAHPGGEEEGWFLAPGVRADRASRVVEVDAFTTGTAPGSIVEFPLITLNSGHEYEALFQTAARAADVRAALSFIGLPDGLPASPAAFRFWPRGEHVSTEVVWSGAGAAPGPDAAPLESFLADAKTRAPFAAEGFVFIGGNLAVDTSGPGSIIPSYNEPVTVFDVPRLAAQGDVYESVVASSNVVAAPWVPATIRLRPEARPEGAPPRRVRDVALRLARDGFRLDGESKPLPPAQAAKALALFRSQNAQDAFVAFSWDGDVPLSEVRRAAELLAALEGSGGDAAARIDAPPAHFPYYKAFLPREEWRDRGERFSQPCELRFPAPDDPDHPAVTLVRVDETWKDDSLRPEISTVSFPLAAPEELPALLKTNAPKGLRVLLVFAPGALPWDAVAPWLDAVRETHPVVQIFLD